MKRVIGNIIYKCEYCEKTFNTPKEASIHEDSCEKRTDLSIRQKELMDRKERKDIIEKFYQSENLKEMNENWNEYIKKYHKNIGNTPIKITLNKFKNNTLKDGYRLVVSPYITSYINHQIDTEIEKFPKIMEKIKDLELAEKDFLDNYESQSNIINEKEKELLLADEEHQKNLNLYKELTIHIENLNKQLKEVKTNLDSSIEKKHFQARELVNYIDYHQKIRNLQKELELSK